MATYQGAWFLREQLESIISQTCREWTLYVSDDGSTDGTVEILKEYADRDPRIILVSSPEGDGPRGAKANFLNLLQHSSGRLVMFADQDDVWEPRKLELFCRELVIAGGEDGGSVPTLFFSDLTVVDERLRVISASYFKTMKLSPYRTALRQVLVQNVATGCASGMNGALRKVLVERPVDQRRIYMHDAWVAMVAAGIGRLVYIDQPTVLYRQHSRNQVGATGFSLISRVLTFRETQGRLRMAVSSAAALVDLFGEMMQEADLAMCRSMASLVDSNPVSRIWTHVRWGLWKATPGRRFGQIVACLWMR